MALLAVVTPGMKGKVLSLHDGFHLDVVQVEPIPPRAIVQFGNGMRLMVDERMKWERVDEPSQSAIDSDAAHDE